MAIIDPRWPRADVWLAGDATHPEVLVVGVPTSSSSLSTSRADLAPLAVRDRFARFSTYQGELDVDLSEVSVRDIGNWPVSELDRYAMPEMVGALVRELPQAFSVFIGGDNAITRPIVSSLGEDLSDLGVITFDAHHDTRSLDDGPTNGSHIRGLIEEDGLPGANIAQIGIQGFSNSLQYRRYTEEAGVTVFTMEQVDRVGITATVDQALDAVAHCSAIHVDVDIDVLDRVFAPGCHGSRPGGMSVRQLAQGVARCARETKVGTIDFVEVDTKLDIDGQTLDVMAHLILTAIAGHAVG
jgi:formiminoglutamase